MMMGRSAIVWRWPICKRSPGRFDMGIGDQGSGIGRASGARSGGVLGLLVVVLLASSGCSKKKEAEAGEAPAPVQVTAVTQDIIKRVVDADGALFPLNQANVVPKINAPVVKFLVNRGDHVKANQLVA